MKNILAENLLRFGVKNLTESQKHALQLLTEDALANITDGCAVVGATKSNTTNAAAVAAFIKAGYTVNGTISSTTCIKKAAGASRGRCHGPPSRPNDSGCPQWLQHQLDCRQQHWWLNYQHEHRQAARSETSVGQGQCAA